MRQELHHDIMTAFSDNWSCDQAKDMQEPVYSTSTFPSQSPAPTFPSSPPPTFASSPAPTFPSQFVDTLSTATPYSDATRRAQLASSSRQRVKRPMNPFMVWSQTQRRLLYSQTPNLNNADVSRMLGSLWRSLTEEQKQPYIQEADRLRRLHKLEFPDYKYRPRKKAKKQLQVDVANDTTEVQFDRVPEATVTPPTSITYSPPQHLDDQWSAQQLFPKTPTVLYSDYVFIPEEQGLPQLNFPFPELQCPDESAFFGQLKSEWSTERPAEYTQWTTAVL